MKFNWAGLVPDIFESLAESLNFTFSLQLPSDGSWGSQNNGHWNGMIGDLIDDIADISPSALSVIETRMSVVDFLPQFERIPNTLVIKRQIKNSWMIFIEPFHIATWMTILSFGLLLTVSLAILVRLGRGKGQREFNFKKCFIYVFGAFNGFAVRRWSHTPVSFSSR